jgi:hypothetical protein
MNALVEDQMRRLRKLLFWVNLASLVEPTTSPARLRREITFGRYTGDTPVCDTDSSRSKPADNIQELGELVTRSDMRRNPPDILVTNFSMLEYALLRSDDHVLLQNARAFKLLVLDEVHTYSGTVGAEVAMLLRRLKSHLAEQSNERLPSPLFIGTSATVGSGPQAAHNMAEFAKSLFGAAFVHDQVLFGRTLLPSRKTASATALQLSGLAEGLASYAKRRPHLLRLIAGKLSLDDEPDWDSHIATDLEELALLLDGCWVEMDREVRDLDRLSQDPEARSRQLLGEIIRRSAVAQTLIDLIQTSESVTIDLGELAVRFFNTSSVPTSEIQQTALSLLLTLLANATMNGRAVFPIRFHHFVTEKREGLVCLSADCPGADDKQSDSWWSTLYLQHSTTCSACDSLVFPLLVCRKCGFAYLEAWRYPDGTCLPEKDEFDARCARILFRPVTGLSCSAEDLDACERALCLSCGCWFESRDKSAGADAQDRHKSKCQRPRIIEIVEWSRKDTDYKMQACAACDQHYYADHEVVTPPTISPFGAASMLIEDLVSTSSTGHRSAKLISFSDTRQQAAKLARSLQRTNRDYVFRQLVFQLLATAPRPLTTVELLAELFKEIRYDDRKRQLLIDSPESVQSDPILEQNLAELLYREATSAYHTLEALGLIRIDYAAPLLALAPSLNVPAQWKRYIGLGVNENLLRLGLDWGFRFRHCVDSAANKVPLRPFSLQRWKIYIKRVAGPQFGKKSQNEAALFLEKVEPRNPLYDFMSRVRDRSRDKHDLGRLEKEDFNTFVQPLWTTLFADKKLLTGGNASLEALRGLIANRPGEPDYGALQLNFNSLIWIADQQLDTVFQCDVCGRLSHYAVSGVCPVRKCQGTLKLIDMQEVEKRFSPTRHYRRLIRERELRPLRVEEHTAEIANRKRLEIEQQFKGSGEEAVDVISGSTTFELGVDLGSISTVFLANLPPRVSNYRQRAGRAGRREGMVPFVLSYVRERPHDQYFWRDLKSFISGPIPTPKFKLASEEVLKRHGFSVILSFVLLEYQKAGCQPGDLWGPAWRNVARFLSQQTTWSNLRERASTGGDICRAVRMIYEGVDEPLRSRLAPVALLHAFQERIKTMQGAMTSRGDDGCIKVLGDYGILPTYAFPIYVDELRLNEVKPEKPPRRDLELTRDRRISLVEYYPGRTVVAGKSQVQSMGIWAGFVEKPFKRCPDCGELFFGSNPPSICSRCGQSCNSCTAVIPWGGYFGKVLGEGSPPEIEYDEVSSTEVVFDPANAPVPDFRPSGLYLSIATIDANLMEPARMRQFSPKPGSKTLLQLQRRTDIRDAAVPNSPIKCLSIAEPQAESVQPFHLLHEFTTDIVRLRIAARPEAQAIQSSDKLTRALEGSSLGAQKRGWIKQNFWLTLAEAMLIASARFLDIDEGGNAELGITFRNEIGDRCMDNRELILFDTAPGGAGYSREVAANLKDVLSRAADILRGCSCGDSCYRCLRSYRNQWIHARLDRHLVSEGLDKFIRLNWPPQNTSRV